MLALRGAGNTTAHKKVYDDKKYCGMNEKLDEIEAKPSAISALGVMSPLSCEIQGFIVQF